MSLGELPVRTTMRGYYKCENVNDSSGNGRTLTNAGTVTFVPGRFSLAASMGTVAAARGLGITTNIFSGLKIPDATISCWVKFNITSNTTTLRTIIQVATAGDSTGTLFGLNYSITSGVMTLNIGTVLSTTNASVDYVMPSLPNTNTWFHIVLVKQSTVTLDLYLNGNLVGTNTGVGTDTATVVPTYKFIIGSNRIAQSIAMAFITIDEVIVEERVWSAAEIRKYYTQAKGRFLTIQ